MAGGNDHFSEEFREHASNYVLLLAICFNRNELDAKTLWKRIESAIRKGLAECDNVDLDRFVSVGLEHVMSNINVAAAHPVALEIQAGLNALDEDARVYFLQYISKRVPAVIVAGRQKWEQHKASLEKQAAELAVEDEQEGGAE